MTFDKRLTAVALNGFCAFLNLYAPQSVLPQLSREFHASAADVSMIMFASTFAVALTAPITGAIADVLGRKRIITAALFIVCVPMFFVAFANNVPTIAVWRFIQGLFLPPIFAVTVAYIGDEWPAAQVAGAAGVYVTGASVGGFTGRAITGVLGDLVGWRSAFVVLAGMTLVAAFVVRRLLPRETKFTRSEGFARSFRQMVSHLNNRNLIPLFAVGFGVLFNFVGLFTFISFFLAAPPYHFSGTMLGAMFVTYLIGAALTPWTGTLVERFGRRVSTLGVIAVWITGLLLTLAHPVGIILLGVAFCATCGLICQAISTGTVTAIVVEGRSSAVGLYVTFFYAGGSAGAFFPGLAWNIGGWPATVATLIGVQLVMAAIVALSWPPAKRRRERDPVRA